MKNKRKEKPKKIEPKAITPNLNALRAIQKGLPKRIALVNQQNPNMINGFFRDHWILEKYLNRRWLFS